MIRNKIYLASLLALVIGLVGCKKDWLDVNEDPETTSNVDPEFLLFASQLEYSNNRTTEIGLSGSMWSQLWASGASASVFRNPERYIFSVFTTGNTWRTHYPNTQKNLQFAIDISEADGKPLIAAQARTMRSLIFYTTTILWGDVPYSEALDPDINNPKFDPQEQVLNGILGELDNAIAVFANPPSPAIIASDHYYSGDINSWLRFARSLKFRTLMLMVDADPSKQSDIQQMLAEGNMITSGTDALFDFYNESGHVNPNWEVINAFAGGQNLFYFASKTTVETMQKYSDPRLDVYFDQGPDTNIYLGVYPGDPGDYGLNSLLSLDVIRPDAPERVFTYTEQLFLEAEAEYRFGSVVTANTKFREAITNSMLYWGVAQADIDTYLAGIPVLSGADQAAELQLIAEQSWISLIDKPIEAWTMWRRREFPELNIPTGSALGSFVRRLPYPPDELSANTNAPVTPRLDEKLWFDQ